MFGQNVIFVDHYLVTGLLHLNRFALEIGNGLMVTFEIARIGNRLMVTFEI